VLAQSGPGIARPGLRTHAFGDVRHVEPIPVDHIVQMAAALFVDAKTVNSQGGIV
jgi:hypothetical protein